MSKGLQILSGTIEIIIAVLIALRSIFPKASFIGGLGGAITFLLTISFLYSTPGAAELKFSFPLLGGSGQFLIKDLVLSGASVWTAAEASADATK